MASWDVINYGVSAKPENKELIKKVFDCLMIDTHNVFGSEREFIFDFDPDVKGNAIESVVNPTQLFHLLNKLFGETYVYVEKDIGQTCSDYYFYKEYVYSPKDNTFVAGSCEMYPSEEPCDEEDECYDGWEKDENRWSGKIKSSKLEKVIDALIKKAISKGYTELVALINEKIK